MRAGLRPGAKVPGSATGRYGQARPSSTLPSLLLRRRIYRRLLRRARSASSTGCCNLPPGASVALLAATGIYGASRRSLVRNAG